MDLSDLLVKYNLVKAPQNTMVTTAPPNPINSRFDRFILYTKNKNNKPSLETPKPKDPNEYSKFENFTISNVKLSEPIHLDGEINNSESNLIPTPNVDLYTEACEYEPQTSTTRIANAQKTLHYTTFLENLMKFYETHPKVNPDNPANSDNKTLLTTFKNYLIKIAGIESNYKNTKSTVKGSTAFGYFLINKNTVQGLGYDYDKFKEDILLLFEVAYKLLENRILAFNSWSKDKVKYSTDNIKNFSDFLIMYALWWRPKSVQSLLKKTKSQKDNDEIKYSGEDKMNLYRILARAREE